MWNIIILMQMMHLNYSQKMTLLLQGILPD
ncbi:hypothetical protein AL1_06060 [Alistipes shahii WAL 8301]|uniref:Uncharacterized protein n=1 Tax=Alistipes shahii WAL 8301 TaxID=717959 RepID=D4IJV7_9BACT|nr:hypothetical protein AL1_06060 [Alistipes shahii WAL 8301]